MVAVRRSCEPRLTAPELPASSSTASTAAALASLMGALNWVAFGDAPGRTVWTGGLLAVVTVAIAALAVVTVRHLLAGTYLPAPAGPPPVAPGEVDPAAGQAAPTRSGRPSEVSG